MNLQRKVIYGERRKVLEGVDIHESIRDSIARLVDEAVTVHCGEAAKDEWDLKGLYEFLNQIFPLAWYAQPDDLSDKPQGQLAEWLKEIALNAYDRREQEIDSQGGAGMFRNIERQGTLHVVDEKWIGHLQAMDYLREGIHLRGYAQIDPLVAFKKEAYEYFQELQNNIQRDIISLMFHLQIVPQPVQYQPEPFYDGDGDEGDGYDLAAFEGPRTATAARPSAARSVLAGRAGSAARRSSVAAAPKVGRNDPCPCGSGKKYKKCCGQSA